MPDEEGSDVAGPARARRTALLGVVVAVVIVVAVLAAYTIGRSGVSPVVTPLVAFAGYEVGSRVTVDVANAQPALLLGQFNVSLTRSGERIADLNPLSDGGSQGPLTFEDRDTNGRLTAGDRFSVERLPGATHRLELWWQNRLVTAASWTLETPVVTFGPLSNPAAGTWSATCAAVAGISGQHTLSSWEVQVLSGTATAIASQSLANFAVPAGVTGGGVTLKVTDVGGSAGGGRLSAGDIFTLSGTATGNQYKILLIWKQTGDQAAEIIFNA